MRQADRWLGGSDSFGRFQCCRQRLGHISKRSALLRFLLVEAGQESPEDCVAWLGEH
jgi:hypothetical protein